MATIMVVAASRSGQQQPLPHLDTLSPQQLREWVIQGGRPGGGDYCAGSAGGAGQQRQPAHPDTLSPQQIRKWIVQRGRPCGGGYGLMEAAALGASEFAAALGASDSAAALGASASTATGPASAEALHTLTLDSGTSRCFFRDCTKVTPLAAPIPVSLTDPTGGPVVARSSTVLQCPGVPSGSLSGLHLRSFLTKLITRDRARRTITLTQSHMVQQVLQRFGFTYSSPQATPLPTRHSLSALPSDESVESSGPYPELVGCLMYLMTCTRPDLAYPLSILARYVAPGRHRPEHMAVAKKVLRYLCSTSGMGLVLGGRSPVVLTGHADASWADDQATQRSSQGYTFSLVQYVDNKAMLALCREQRLEHRTKHIALRYFLARELQQRGQLRLAYVASEANTADVFTKALAPCDHQRFCTQLGLVPVLPHLLTS
ncbi:unnamed protein product [Closterium sp. NIES-54]